MAEHQCAACGNEDVIKLATCWPAGAVEGTLIGIVHCPDCHHETPWHLSKGQRHLICSNRADRKTPPE